MKNVAVYAGYDCYKADLALVNYEGIKRIGTIEEENPVVEDKNDKYYVEISDDDPNFKDQCKGKGIDYRSTDYAFKSSDKTLIYVDPATNLLSVENLFGV